MKIAIVGAGIAAECFKHYFFRRANELNLEFALDQYSSTLAAPTSNTSTSIISRRGLKRNLSELGDTLDDAYLEFQKFISIYPDIAGLTETKIVHRCSLESEKAVGKFIRRFGQADRFDEYLEVIEPAFIVENQKMINWFKIDQAITVNQVDKLITSPAELIQYDFVFYFTGSAGKIFDLTGAETTNHAQLAHGSFLQFENFEDVENIFSENLIYEIDGVDLIYRRPAKQLIIGASTANIGAQFSHDIISLKNFHQQISQKFIIPKFDEFKFISGLRLKGRKRLPSIHVGDEPNSFVVNSLYKNGYTLCFLGAKKACDYFFDFIK